MKSSGIEITRRDASRGGRYEALAGGGKIVGELLYDQAPDNIIIARHTEVDPSQRGKGIAQQLVERLVADARADGAKILPRCSYVRSRFAAHPEWSDLLKQA